MPLPVEREPREYWRTSTIPGSSKFANYVKHVATFDFGPSLNRRALTVDAVIEHSLPVTAQLVALTALVAVPLGLALGARLVRASVVETLDEDFVRTAQAKGLRRGRIVLVHVLRNSSVSCSSGRGAAASCFAISSRTRSGSSSSSSCWSCPA